MRFMMLMIAQAYNAAPADARPTADAVEQMMKYNESLASAGMLVSLDGLHPPVTGTRVHFAGGKATRVDGPFTEAKEVLGGYWVINAKSQEDAVAWALRIPAADGDIVEVRQIFETEDYPADVQKVIEASPLGARP
ncbi:MAG: YciI family protein [Cytophagaceae bacterium]|nr:YciI family protein [Gemmatimonadaceae bacterium]